MGTRIELHEELCDILGSRNAYFQPPENIKINYPCVVYLLKDMRLIYADDYPYKANKAYEVTIIDENPDSDICERMLMHFPMTNFNRFYTSDDLNHWNITIYY